MVFPRWAWPSTLFWSVCDCCLSLVTGCTLPSQRVATPCPAAGLSGLARSAAPAAAVPVLPALPQELLRTLLLAVYPLQV